MKNQVRKNIVDFTVTSIGNLMLAFPFINHLFNFRRASLRIVYYHIVASQNREYYFDDKIITPEIFRQHISFLKRHFSIISLTDALAIAERGKSLEGKLVLTFDDGFVENYTVVAPILKEMGLTATFFLIGNCIGNNDLMWRNKLVVVKRKAGRKLPGLIAESIHSFSLPPNYYYEDILAWSLRTWPMNRKDEIANFFWNAAGICPVREYLEEKRPYLAADQIHNLLGEGFEIGSHSMSHPVCSRLSFDEFRDEVLVSTQLLETSFKTTVKAFAYPFGIKAGFQFEKRLVSDACNHLKTLLGTRNKLTNDLDCLQWERDNLEFPMNKMVFRLNILPLLRRVALPRF